ncbi:hypothetical protein TGAMA5MH_02413 [Trichoderma gamsii]|uniref:Uncharacterized protein n=1 Tax=Trichoderma gamsii TaxID=398673 RepID=A0A2K0TLG9_9HYPO|nr:hypothetical protein TGAMA5MH_02413 [Trichoderma gamsii]
MRFTRFIAAAVLAAPLALAAPVSAPATLTTADLNCNLTIDPRYTTALSHVKERYPNLAKEDANTAALGYLEAVGVHVAGGFCNSTALTKRDRKKKACCNNCEDCFSAIFTLGGCCISDGWKWHG